MLSIIFTDISSWCLIIFAPCTVAGWVCIVVCIFNLCNWLHKYLWCSQAGRTENRVARKVWKCFFPILFCFVFYFISFYYYQWAAWRATLILASWGWWSVSSHHTITNLWLPQGMNENKKKKKKRLFFCRVSPQIPVWPLGQEGSWWEKRCQVSLEGIQNPCGTPAALSKSQKPEIYKAFVPLAWVKLPGVFCKGQCNIFACKINLWENLLP